MHQISLCFRTTTFGILSEYHHHTDSSINPVWYHESLNWHFTVPSAVHRWYCRFFFIFTVLPESPESRFPWKWSPWLYPDQVVYLFLFCMFCSAQMFCNLIQSCTVIWEWCKCANEAVTAQHPMLPSCRWCTQPCLPVKDSSNQHI